MSYRVLALVPGWLNELKTGDGQRTSELLHELGARWGVALALDPGGPGLCRGGMRFPPRAQRDFFEHVKEALFDARVEVILAVGEAASIENLHRVAGWSPTTPRVCLLRRENFSPAWREQIPGMNQLSDLVLLSDPWPDHQGTQPHDWVMARTAVQACEKLGGRFLPAQPRPSREFDDAGRDGISVLVLGSDQNLRRRLDRLPFPSEWITVPRGRGGIVGWNAALQRARYRCVLSVRGGTGLIPASLERMKEYLEGEAPLAAVGAVRGQPSRAGSQRQLASARLSAGRSHRECAHYLDSSCWMLRRNAAALAGGLDERYQTWAAAVFDYCLRLRQLNQRLLIATDILTFPPTEPPPAARDAEADMNLLLRKWCLGPTSALEQLFRRGPA